MPVGERAEAEIEGLGPVTIEVLRAIGGTTEARVYLQEHQRPRLIEKLHTGDGEPGTGLVATFALLAGIGRRLVSGGLGKA